MPERLSLLRVGLIGTGYAARLRAETLVADARSHLVAVVGHDAEKTAAFCQTYQAEAIATWQDLVIRPDLDLVIIATINRDHGAIARAALEANKHIVVEYPLTLEVAEAEGLLALAKARQRLLHIEHIDQLSGIHQTLVDALPHIGTPFYVRYDSTSAQRPAPAKWTYHPQLFGFPLVGALSRIHRLVDLFGRVAAVTCQSRFQLADGTLHSDPDRPLPYVACLCSAQLRFTSGLIADLIYGKGEAIWRSERRFEVHGSLGLVRVDPDGGELVLPEGRRSLTVGSRRGLFAQDTTMVLDCLTQGTPLYTTPSQSIYALQVADATRRAAATNQVVLL
ncbi:MAG: Gfo/Idh/MocA family oxidoreductase [Synechococcales bacterium]|nr:Gfo/Idh/MocA family oxidoreductase [Synechococcales bacterium]